MARLNEAVRHDHARAGTPPAPVLVFSRTPSVAGYLAMAALLALVTISVLFAWRGPATCAAMFHTVGNCPGTPT